MKEKLVFPGSFLSLGEEYLPGEGTFESREGDIHSSSVGEPVFDNAQKVVSVKDGISSVKLIDEGSVIFGKVELVKESNVFVEILEGENNNKKRSIGSAPAVLAIFNTQNSYVKYLSDLFKVGDIIKARVANVSPFNIELETKSHPSFGVVKGFCAKCRAPIRMLDNGFKCPKCATVAFRKFSSDYLVR